MDITPPHADDTFLKELTGVITEGVLSFDASGAIVFTNRAAAEVLGYAPDELLERTVDELLPNDQSAAFAHLQRRASVAEEAITDLSLRHETDREIPVTIAVTHTRHDDRQLFIVNFHERTARDGRGSVRNPETALRYLFDHSADGIAVFDPESAEITDCNEPFRELLGYSYDDLRSLDPADRYPQGEDRFRALLEQTADDGRDRTDELEFRNDAGQLVPLRSSTSIVEIANRRHVLANVRERPDRTEHETRLEALNEASRRLMAAETSEEIGRIAVDVAETVLGRSFTAVWLATGDALRAVAASEEATDASSSDASGPVGPITGGTAEMTIYESGKTAVIEEYDAVENPAHPELGLEARLVVPLGEHGLLAVGSTDSNELDAPLRELVEILAKNARAAFDRLEREQLVRQRSGATDAAIDGMAITDEDGVYTYMNDVHAELFGYDDPGAVIGTHWQRLFDASEVTRYESEVRPALEEQGSWRGEAIGRHTDGTRFPLEITLSTLTDGGVVCIIRDIIERKAQERQLESLNDVAQELMKTDDFEAISRIGIEAVEDVLGFESACLRLLGTDTKRLEFAALTDEAEALLETHAAYDLESTLAGHAFRNAQTIVDRLPSETGTRWPTTEYSSLHVPVGTHGVISIILRDGEDVDDRDVQLAEMLSVTVRTAIDRVERVQLLRTHEREARQQRDQLETLNRISALVQEIGRRLIEATTRAELERTICDHLVNSDLYSSAWIGDVEASTDRVRTHAGSGITDRDLEAINEMSISSVGHGTVDRMIETGSIEVARHYQLDGRSSRTDADDSVEDVLSTAAIPITYGDRPFGVLVVNGTGQDVFGAEAIRGFESLGEVTGFAINAIRNRKLLLSDSVVELEFAISDPQAFYLRVSELGCECRVERSIPIEEGNILKYYTITGCDPTSVLAVAADSERIEDAHVISEGEESFLLQTLASKSTTQIALQVGATLRSAVAVDGEARIVLEAPQTANVREIVTLFEESFSSVDLVAKHERDRSIQTADEFRQTVDGRLTEKQRSAIESAYASGYYDWPRATTAEELAEAMGISSSTLHQHLRKGIWNLLAAFLDEQRE